MSAKQKVIQIVTGIRSDLESVQSLEEIMVEQRKHLSAADATSLDTINGKILSITSSLESNSQTRTRILEDFGLTPDRAGLSILAKKLPKNLGDEVLEKFDSIELSLNKCKSLNDRNGELLNSQKEFTDSFFQTGPKQYAEGIG